MDIINNKLSESFGSYEYLSIGTLKVDDDYQRNKIYTHIKNIAEMINNSTLLKKLENLDSLLIRDQVTTESLYIIKT